MGLFSFLFGKEKDIDPISIPDRAPFVAPNVPDFATGQELVDFGQQAGQQIAPLGLQSREQALGFLQDPTTASQFFQGFQPSSFEQGVADSTFGNMLRRAERSAGHRASSSGIESAFPELFSEAIGPTIGNIGQFLSGQNQRRGEFTLSSLLGIDPIAQILNPLAGIEQGQDALQKGTQFQTDLEQALRDFELEQTRADDKLFSEQQRVLGEKQAATRQASRFSNITTLAGGGIGTLTGLAGGGDINDILAGLGIGAGLGGTFGSLLGGSDSPLALVDALQIGQVFKPELFPGSQQNQQSDLLQQLLNLKSGGGGGTTSGQPTSVFPSIT